jgi:hypothetical protein
MIRVPILRMSGVPGDFMAHLAVLASAAFVIVSVALWLPSFLLNPCQ